MSVELRALFLGAAVVLFLLAAYDELRAIPNHPRAVGLIAAGLAAATFPAFWDALDAALN